MIYIAIRLAPFLISGKGFLRSGCALRLWADFSGRSTYFLKKTGENLEVRFFFWSQSCHHKSSIRIKICPRLRFGSNPTSEREGSTSYWSGLVRFRTQEVDG